MSLIRRNTELCSWQLFYVCCLAWNMSKMGDKCLIRWRRSNCLFCANVNEPQLKAMRDIHRWTVFTNLHFPTHSAQYPFCLFRSFHGHLRGILCNMFMDSMRPRYRYYFSIAAGGSVSVKVWVPFFWINFFSLSSWSLLIPMMQFTLQPFSLRRGKSFDFFFSTQYSQLYFVRCLSPFLSYRPISIKLSTVR